MPTGMKATSSIVPIGFTVSESAPNTFAQGMVDLNLSPLDSEVFVVLAINLDPSYPDAVAATDTKVNCSLTTTSQTAVQTLSNANCLAAADNTIRASGFLDGGVGFQTRLETPPANLDFLGIIATSDFWIQVQGANNVNAFGVSGKLYGYRSRVTDPAIYAALVQSEVLSA